MRHVPTVASTIERRLLVNYRVHPSTLERLLPAGFRPQLVNGVGVAGICLIRLGQLRPAGLPRTIRLTTENAAHRVAVEWDGPEGPRHGVFIPRRDTSSLLTAIIGGRVFPGEHHRARFQVRESGGRYEVAFASLDGTAKVAVALRAVKDWQGGSIFASLAEASAFFRESPIGWSATSRPGDLDGVELCCESWRFEPMAIEHVESSLFGDAALFPGNAVELDSALLMRDIPVTWKSCDAQELGQRPDSTSSRKQLR